MLLMVPTPAYEINNHLDDLIQFVCYLWEAKCCHGPECRLWSQTELDLNPGSTTASFVRLSKCGRQANGSPKDAGVLIPETCEYVTLPGKRDFVDTIKFLRWSILDYLGGPNIVIRRGSESEREIGRCYAVDFEDVGRGHKPRNASRI